MKKVSSLPNHYDSIEDLSLYRWDKFTQTKDNNWFLVDYNGRQTKLEPEILKEVENSLIDQYFKAVDDRSFSNKMQKWGKIDWLKAKYQICNVLLDNLYNSVISETNEYSSEQRFLYINELKKWRLNFPILNSVYDDLALINEYKSALEGLKTEIAIINKELISDAKEDSNSLIKQLQIATISLGYSYRLDPKQISVAEWIEICKLVQDKAKNN